MKALLLSLACWATVISALAQQPLADAAVPTAMSAQDFLFSGGAGRISLEGTVSDVFFDDIDRGYVFVVLDCEGSFVYATCSTSEPEDTLLRLRPLCGRRVRATGVDIPVHKFPYNRAVTRHQLKIDKPSDVVPVDRFADTSFASPDVDSQSLQLHDLTRCGRMKTSGVVLARWQGNRIILQKRNGQPILVQFRDGADLPERSASIDVEGYPETDLYRIDLMRAVWRPSAATNTPTERSLDLSLEELFQSEGRYILNAKYYGRPIAFRAVLKEFITAEDGHRRLLLQEGGFDIQVDCYDAPEVLENLEIGSVVSATGICIVESDFWRPAAPFPKNNRLFLVLRNAADITVIKGPPWWTPLRLAIVIGVLIGALLLFIVWNVSLRVLVERRSREVLRAQEKKLESELRVAERTRLAADLHDSLSQNLTVIGYQVSAAQNLLGDKDMPTGACLATAAKMIRSCRTDLRRCLWDLRNDVLDEPDFATAIRRTVEPVAGEASLQIAFAGRRSLISDSTAHALLNIIRELVANAVRHGYATEIRVVGEVTASGLALTVHDNGCGFDTEKRPGQDEGHFGLDGIAERIERLEGDFTLTSAPGSGTTARISITPKRQEEP